MNENREAGLTIPLVAVFIVVLIFMLALAMDLGVLYTARTSAQHAADAGALAGAFTYGDTSASNPTGTATAAAISAATKNDIWGAPVPTSEVTVTPNPPYLTVSITHVAPTFFARVVGTNFATITVTATAQALLNPGGTSCLRPFWILRSALGGCPSVPTPGQSIGLVGSNNPNCTNGNSPSQWGFINMNGGAQAIQESIQTCNFAPVKCGDPMVAETGNISSINHLNPAPEFFGPSTGCPLGNGQDCYNAPYNYSIGGPNGQVSNMSQSVVTVAVLDDCNGQTAPASGGQQTLNIMDFAQIFIDGISGNGNGCGNPLTLNANLIQFNGCGTGSGSASGSAIASYGPKVMLVQPQ